MGENIQYYSLVSLVATRLAYQLAEGRFTELGAKKAPEVHRSLQVYGMFGSYIFPRLTVICIALHEKLRARFSTEQLSRVRSRLYQRKKSSNIGSRPQLDVIYLLLCSEL